MSSLCSLLTLLILSVLVLTANAQNDLNTEDPNLWLEEVAGERAMAWVRQRNEASTTRLADSEEFRTLEARLLSIMDSDDRIPMISEAGGWYYNFWRDAKHKRGLWRRTTLEEYRKDAPAWEVILDLDALAASEKENWVWRGASFLPPRHERCLIHLSRGGADATVVREFDTGAKAFVKGGFMLPEAKTRVAWRSIDSLFVATDFGPGSLTSSGYPRIVKEWTRGVPLSQATTVFEGRHEDIRVDAYRSHAKGFERDIISRSLTFWTHERFLRRDGRLIKIETPDDSQTTPFHDLLFIELRSDWRTGDKTYPAGALLVTDFEGFLAGRRDMTVLFEPTDRRSLAGFTLTKSHVVINELDNVRNRLHLLTRKDGQWRREPLPGAPEFCTMSASAVDSDESDDYFLTISGFLTPLTLAHGTLGGGPATTLKTSRAYFDAKGLSVTQHEAVSKDGTRVPYFQVARTDLPLNGSHPTLLSGYGGFEIPRLPGYNATVGAGWLERGGVYVVANIRGGGEFGPKWHQAALKANRPRAYEDFIAIAEDLVRRRVTSPRHLGIQGGSNGGLLMGNMITLRPDLFGAVVCQVPLLDMKRYHKLLAGASWMAEYGDPDDPQQWDFIRTFSPYHNLKPGVTYPPILFTTSTRDDRVHPGHARKMAAKMLAMQQDVLYYENIEGGHGGAADNRQAAFMSALAYTFLRDRLNPEASKTKSQEQGSP